MTTLTVVEFDAFIRDVRHRAARAASDLAEWLEYLNVDGKSERTLYGYDRELALLLRMFPDHALEDFTASEINRALAQKPERSRYITRSIFNAFFHWATEETDPPKLDRSPMRGVPRMRQPRRRPRDIFTEAEVEILEGLPAPHGQLFTLLFGTGIRRGEARSLRRDHINLARRTLVVYRGKGGKDRTVPLTLAAQKAVAELDLTEGLQENDFVWTLIRVKRYRFRKAEIGDTTIDRWYRTQLAAAGLRHLNMHQTRHTYGWRMRDEGFDLEERKVLMGHERTDITDRYYGRLTAEDVLAKMVERGI